MSKKPYYLTTAIAYTSGKPHIGNTYEIVLADAIVRYKRFQGYRYGRTRAEDRMESRRSRRYAEAVCR